MDSRMICAGCNKYITGRIIEYYCPPTWELKNFCDEICTIAFLEKKNKMPKRSLKELANELTQEIMAAFLTGGSDVATDRCFKFLLKAIEESSDRPENSQNQQGTGRSTRTL